MFPRHPFIYKCALLVLIIVVFFYSLLLQRADHSHIRKYPWQQKISDENFLRLTSKSYAGGSHVTKTDVLHLSSKHYVTDEPVTNPHNFDYLLNPVNMCVGQDVYLIIYIHTAPSNFRRRQMIRHTWGNPGLLRKIQSKLVFVMGQVNDEKLMNSVKVESNRYQDIVQESFTDTYRNLTYKGIAALKWVSNHCNQAAFALKTDDDILVNIYKIREHVEKEVAEKSGAKEHILCNQWVRMKVLRDKKSKWYIPKEDFSPDFFPPYCSGSAFIMSMDVIEKMYRASFHTPFFWVDDYYITGALANKINVKQKRLNAMYMLNGRVGLEKFKNDTQNLFAFFHIPKSNTIYQMWTIMKQRMEKQNDMNLNRTKKV